MVRYAQRISYPHSNYHLQGLIYTQKLTNHDESDATIVPIIDSHTN
jgi:hypothetical protein